MSELNIRRPAYLGVHRDDSRLWARDWRRRPWLSDELRSAWSLNGFSIPDGASVGLLAMRTVLR